MEPSIGRIVHYRANSGRVVCPAIITRLSPDRAQADLVVFGLPGCEAATIRLGISEGNEPGCWHWPEREEASGGA